MTITEQTSRPELTVVTLPPAEGWMANLDLLMRNREDAYEEMRRAIPGLAWTLADRVELTAGQIVAKERFDQLNRLVRGFRSV